MRPNAALEWQAETVCGGEAEGWWWPVGSKGLFGGLSPVGVPVAELKHYNLRDNRLIRPSWSCMEESKLLFTPLSSRVQST